MGRSRENGPRPARQRQQSQHAEQSALHDQTPLVRVGVNHGLVILYSRRVSWAGARDEPLREGPQRLARATFPLLAARAPHLRIPARVLSHQVRQQGVQPDHSAHESGNDQKRLARRNAVIGRVGGVGVHEKNPRSADARIWEKKGRVGEHLQRQHGGQREFQSRGSLAKTVAHDLMWGQPGRAKKRPRR